MLKYKKTIWIALAIVFIIFLFVLKTTSLSNSLSKNKETYQRAGQENANGLSYGDLSLQDLVNKDTDGDGILDWQENLYGLDPTKKETTPGISDSVAITKLRTEQGNNIKITDTDKNSQNIANLSQTDKFSRELFATIATASQNGTMDQAAIDKLGASLADQIKNSPPRKIFSISEIKVINDNSIQALNTYNNAMDKIYKKYPGVNYTILDVLQKFMIDENNVDTSVLVKLNPIIEQINNIIGAMIKTSVPESISVLHLNFINAEERLMENLSDIQLYDSDPIVALGGISNYEVNANKLESAINSLANTIMQKLSPQ